MEMQPVGLLVVEPNPQRVYIGPLRRYVRVPLPLACLTLQQAVGLVLKWPLGLLLGVWVTAADGGDREGLISLLKAYFATGVKRLRKLWVDGGYSGKTLKEWVQNLKQTHKIDLEVVDSQGPGFQVVKRRWVVERTFAWLLNYRRHSKDYEVLTRNSEALIQVAMIHLLVKRLAA